MPTLEASIEELEESGFTILGAVLIAIGPEDQERVRCWKEEGFEEWEWLRDKLFEAPGMMGLMQPGASRA